MCTTTPSSSSESSSDESSDDGGSSSSNSSTSDESESSNDGDESSGSDRGQRRHRRDRRGIRRHQPRMSLKDLKLPTYMPSPSASVSTWIDRVDLALEGAAESGRGRWSNRTLYFLIGPKSMDDAARWWVNLNRRLPSRKKTWSYLKKALERRRVLMPGETYADFGAGLRAAVGKNKVKERVLLAQFYKQFYKCLDKTTRKLVKQGKKPRTLEKAVKEDTKIDDPNENVARCMTNIDQSWATAPMSDVDWRANSRDTRDR
ncbi:hypothetical protein PHMEG_00021849 [Phytophthora megakarya]|uniref:Retrotransposon gag domain-containing protein n=1 Tax=Phytophthora megakarya TaxID=4795 RepID=A0A225VK91_9STRA|nr:hypothetical protein PHMEG_00021849 [Phytophthora megakarya]